MAAGAALLAGLLATRSPAWAAAARCVAAGAAWRALTGPAARAASLSALALVAAAGFFTPPSPPPLSAPLDVPIRVKGRVCADPRPGPDGPRLDVDVGAVSGPVPGPWRPSRGRVLLRIRARDGRGPRVARGDAVVFRARLRKPGGVRNPGGRDTAGILARRGIAAVATAEWPGRVAVARAGPGTPALDRWRRDVSEAVSGAVPGPAGAVLRAVALGDRSGIGPDLYQGFRRAGTAHLLAISGLHLGALAVLLLPVARWGLGRVRRFALARPVPPAARIAVLPALAAYAALSGFQVSTLRALVMVVLLVLAGALSRRLSPLSLLAATALVLGLGDPTVLLSPGLHLSLAALAGLFWLAPRLERTWRPDGAPDPVSRLDPAPGIRSRVAAAAVAAFRRVAAASVATTLTTLPVAAFHFGAGSLAGFVTNLVAVPLIGFVAVPLALAGVAVHGLWPLAAAAIWRAASAPVSAVLGFQDRAAPLFPLLHHPALRSPATVLGQFLLVAALVAALDGRRGRAAALAVIGTAAVLAPPAAGSLALRLSPDTRVWALDVGAGLSVVVQTPGPRWIVIDGGGSAYSRFDPGERIVVPALEALGARRLAAVVSTHPHPDHLGGLPAVVAWGRPEVVWAPASFRNDPRYRQLREAAVVAGARLAWVPAAGLSRGLGPAGLTARWVPGPTENDRSMVVWIRSPGGTVLVGGDVEVPAQREMVAAGWLPRATLLVAPHHGSADATWPPWIEAVAPRRIWVSAGRAGNLPCRQLEAAAARLAAVVENTRDQGCLNAVLSPPSPGANQPAR